MLFRYFAIVAFLVLITRSHQYPTECLTVVDRELGFSCKKYHQGGPRVSFSGGDLEDVSLCIEKDGEKFVTGINANTFNSGDLPFVNVKTQSARQCDYNCEIPKACQSILYKSEGTEKVSILGTEFNGIVISTYTKISFKIPKPTTK